MSRKQIKVFDTDQRIRLGIWGLGRGMSFYHTCRLLNIDVVAGCDYNAHMREKFLAANPGALATADAQEFLDHDFDAVLLATYCPNHAEDAIRCLQAGKHVLAEVTSFFTLAQGVRLVEAVEKSGRIYNLAENYPFSAANMYLAHHWQAGLFGELMYAEYEYMHECRALSYTYIDGMPVQPGHTVHNWRSWMDFHYYCTHSLGPVMVITGRRPTRVVALPARQRLAGYLIEGSAGTGMGGISPSLISMDNGGVVRNLMGASTNDSHIQRIWGTLGSAELNTGKGLQLRLGAAGTSPKLAVTPRAHQLGVLASKTGHGGGDFWVLYYFARQIFTGEKAPFDIYQACDVTIPGIQAYRSSQEEGQPQVVPDFRQPKERDAFRNDHWQPQAYDYQKGVFGGISTGLASQFSRVMAALTRYAPLYRAYVDWKKIRADLVTPDDFLRLALALLPHLKELQETYAQAVRISQAYPGSDGARLLKEMLELGHAETVMARGFAARFRREWSLTVRKYMRLPPAEAARLLGPGVHLLRTYTSISSARISALLPESGSIRKVGLPSKGLVWRSLAVQVLADRCFLDMRPVHESHKDGLIYGECIIQRPRRGRAALQYGADGPVKLWLNGKEVACRPEATNPLNPPRFKALLQWRRGPNKLLFAMRTNGGKAWGLSLLLPA